MAIQLTTLGGLRAHRDGAELDWLLGQRLRAALFVYLAVERRVSRESLATVFWPESSGENARHALRQSLYHLRKALGPDWLEAGPHELRVSGEVCTDVHAFVAALESGDAESAVRLYTGPFLEGVNLVDLKPWESWVDGRRAQYARAFRKACREVVEARRAAGDLAGAIEAAQRWVAPDPWDDEAQHQLIEALADAGEQAEAIRQYETYARLLEPEGLRPLEETVELIERVRSGVPAVGRGGKAAARGVRPADHRAIPADVRGPLPSSPAGAPHEPSGEPGNPSTPQESAFLDHLRRLVLEAHRRSLWQVLGVYLVSSWAVLQVVNDLTRSVGLPDWVPGFALVLLLIGLPIVMATAVVQEGAPGQARQRPEPAAFLAPVAAAAAEAPPAETPPPGVLRPQEPPVRPSFLRRHLTWRRSLLGGVAAFGFLALLTAGYLVSWATGIGPVGSLLARGAIEQGERIVLADFGSAADPALGAVVTDALRIDLLETPILRVLEPTEVREILKRMQVKDDQPLTAALAREVALRESAKAVLEGEVARAGTGYVLTAVLRAAESGESLAAFRETARGEEEFIPAIDRLSRRIRERAGESLRSIHASPPLERVTTSSLDALRLFSQADRAFDRADYRRAIALLEETLELDPEFAMAWRRLAVALGNTEMDRVRELQAATRAYELRHRLSPRERYLAAARYYAQITGDSEAMIEAYRRVLEIDPNDRAALNNLALEYGGRQDYDAAAELLQRAVQGPGVSAVAFRNLIEVRIAQGRLEDARRVVEAFAARYPDNLEVAHSRFWVLLLQGDESGARSQVEPLLADPARPPVVRARAHDHEARLAMLRGRISEARRHLETAEQIGAEVGPSYRVVRRLFRAHAEVVVGDPERAVRLVPTAGEGMLDELAPPNQWHFFRAIVFAMASRPAEAEAVLQSFEAEVPREFHDQFWIRNESARALVHLQRGDPEGAIRILEQIRASRSCWACYAERMGWALREAGRPEAAAREWETALAWKDLTHAIEWQFGQNLWVLQRIGPLYEELGDTARALGHYRRLVELWAGADPELQPRVRHARERIAALERGG